MSFLPEKDTYFNNVLEHWHSAANAVEPYVCWKIIDIFREGLRCLYSCLTYWLLVLCSSEISRGCWEPSENSKWQDTGLFLPALSKESFLPWVTESCHAWHGLCKTPSFSFLGWLMLHESQTVNCFNLLKTGRMVAKWTFYKWNWRHCKRCAFMMSYPCLLKWFFPNGYFPMHLEEAVSRY